MSFLMGLIAGLAIGWLCKDRVWAEIQPWLPPQLKVEPATPPEAPQSPPVVGPVTIRAADKLQQIKGIGPTFARRFYEAGIYTFADLAALTPDQAHEIAQVKSGQKIGPDAWIAEAKRLAEVKRLADDTLSG